jgi:hypothetical protein
VALGWALDSIIVTAVVIFAGIVLLLAVHNRR